MTEIKLTYIQSEIVGPTIRVLEPFPLPGAICKIAHIEHVEKMVKQSDKR